MKKFAAIFVLFGLILFGVNANAQCRLQPGNSAPQTGEEYYSNSGAQYTTFTPGSQNWEIDTSTISRPSGAPPAPYVLHTNPGNGNGSQSPQWLTTDQQTGFQWQYNELQWSFWFGRGRGVGKNGGNNDGSVVWLYTNSRTTLDLINTPGLVGLKVTWHHNANVDNMRLSEIWNGVEHIIGDFDLIDNLDLYEWGTAVKVVRTPGGSPTGSTVRYRLWTSTDSVSNPNYANSSVSALSDPPNDANVLRIDVTSNSDPLNPLYANPGSYNSGYLGIYSYYAGSRKDAAEYNQLCWQDNGAQPVELTSFTAEYRNDQVNLNWHTETETNNFGFEVQRSIEHNGDWESLGFIEGNGTSNSPNDYSFTDVPNADGASTIAYRLKQIDRDGSAAYSNTILVTVAPQSTDVLYNFPNPFNPTTNITFTLLKDDVVTLNVYNTAGEKVAELYDAEQMSAGYHTASFNGTNLPSGRYFYRLTTSAGTKTNSMVLSK